MMKHLTSFRCHAYVLAASAPVAIAAEGPVLNVEPPVIQPEVVVEPEDMDQQQANVPAEDVPDEADLSEFDDYLNFDSDMTE